MVQEEEKKSIQRGHRAIAILCDCGVRIEAGVKKSLQFRVLAGCLGRKGGEGLRETAQVFGVLHATFQHPMEGVVDQVGGKAIENLLEGFVEFQFAAALGIEPVNFLVGLIEDGHFGAQQIEIQKAGFEAVVEVGGVVSDFVNEIDELRLQKGLPVQEIFGERGKFDSGITSRMFDDTFAHFESEIEPGEIEVALLELFDDAKRVEVVVKAIASFSHSEIELLFAGVAERWVPDIVDESERFGEAGVEPQSIGNSTRN